MPRLARLRSISWATELVASVEQSELDFMPFRVSIALTDEGARHVSDILTMLYQACLCPLHPLALKRTPDPVLRRRSAPQECAPA